MPRPRLPADSVSLLAAQRILLLKAHDWESDSALARRLGLTPQTISNYRQGTNGASVEVLARVVSRTDVNARWLLTGEGPQRDPPKGTSATDIYRSGTEALIADLRRYLDRLEAQHAGIARDLANAQGKRKT